MKKADKVGKKLDRVEKICGYKFKDRGLLRQALTHSSVLNEDASRKSYERLEFLGDAVIDLVVSEDLIILYPEEDEGQLTEKRARLVKGTTLAHLCKCLKLENYIDFGDSLHLSEISESKYADIIESLIGAIFLDANYDEAKRVFMTFVYSFLPVKKRTQKSPKNILQEFFQKKHAKEDLRYVTYKQEGKPNEPTFYVKVFLGRKYLAKGQGSSKKRAEQAAATRAIERLDIHV